MNHAWQLNSGFCKIPVLIPWHARQAAQCSQMAETQNYAQCLKLLWVRGMHDAHTQMHGRDSAPDLSVKLSPCLCSCPGWKMAAFSICVVTCMVCVPQPTTKSRVCCSLNTILHFCSIWIWSSLVCVVLVCEGWMAQTYCGKTVGKDGSMKVKTHQIQCTTVYDRKKQYFCCNLCLILLLFHIQLCIMHIVVTVLFSILTHRIKVCKLKSLVLSSPPICLQQRCY